MGDICPPGLLRVLHIKRVRRGDRRTLAQEDAYWFKNAFVDSALCFLVRDIHMNALALNNTEDYSDHKEYTVQDNELDVDAGCVHVC